MNRILFQLTILGMAIFTFSSCKTTGQTEQLVSIVPTGPGQTEGMAKLASWKVQAEVLAKRSPESAQVSYEIAQKSVDLWVRRKGAESRRLAARNLGTVNLGASSVPGVEPLFKTFVAAADSSRFESAVGAAAAISILSKLSALGKANRAASAEALQEELELLRWEDWDSIRG